MVLGLGVNTTTVSVTGTTTLDAATTSMCLTLHAD